MNANREFKNSVFTTLFNDPEKLLSLYNAVSGNQLQADTPIVIATLDDVLFTDWRNDIAFVLNDKIVILVEHQSTISGSMPLRLLIYMARVYEKLIDKDAIYRRMVVSIPKPDFIVLYNGVEAFPSEKTLRLSDAYKEHPSEAMGLGGSLELEVRVVNINEGLNDAVLEKSEALGGYARFVGKVRRNESNGMDLNEAISKAVKDCIEEGVLVDFLNEHGSEVINLLTAEWNLDRALYIRAQEAREEGLNKGLSKGRDEERIIIAKNLLNLAIPIEQIVIATGLTRDEVSSLRVTD